MNCNFFVTHNSCIQGWCNITLHRHNKKTKYDEGFISKRLDGNYILADASAIGESNRADGRYHLYRWGESCIQGDNAQGISVGDILYPWKIYNQQWTPTVHVPVKQA